MSSGELLIRETRFMLIDGQEVPVNTEVDFQHLGNQSSAAVSSGVVKFAVKGVQCGDFIWQYNTAKISLEVLRRLEALQEAEEGVWRAIG